VAQSFTAKNPVMKLGAALESSVAMRENTCPPLHPASLTASAGGNILTWIVAPSMSPDVEGITELAKLSVKYLPDCEVVKPTSRNVATAPAHGKAASAGPLTCIFQRPAIAVGATSLRPLLSTPTSPSTGMITSIRYAIAKFLFAGFTGCSLCMGISELQRALSDWHNPDCI